MINSSVSPVLPAALRTYTIRSLKAAHAEAAEKGLQRGIPHDEILPMLPSRLADLTLELALLEVMPGKGSRHWSDGANCSHLWADIDVGKVDPRIADYKQAERRGITRSVSGLGHLLIGEPEGQCLKYTVRLIRPRPGGTGGFTVHWLTDFDGCELDLGAYARLCANAIADDTSGWRWYPRIRGKHAGGLNGEWTFQPGDGGYADVMFLAQLVGERSVMTCAILDTGYVAMFRDDRTAVHPRGQVLGSNDRPLRCPDLTTARRKAEQLLNAS